MPSSGKIIIKGTLMGTLSHYQKVMTMSMVALVLSLGMKRVQCF